MDTNSDLRAAYEALLKDHGLDQISRPMQAAMQNQEEMAQKGWYAEGLLDREKHYKELLQVSTNIAENFNPDLQQIANEVEDAVKHRGAKLSRRVFVGGFPLEEANACIRHLRETDGSLVLVNHGLMQFVYQIGKAFVFSYDWLNAAMDEDGKIVVWDSGNNLPASETMADVVGWESCGWTRPNSISAITAILDSHVHVESVASSPRQGIPTPERATTLGAIVHYAEMFVVAHEYAHLILNHVSVPSSDAKSSADTLRDQREFSRQQEFDADELATSLLLASSDWHSPMGEFDVNARAAGISLVFTANAFQALAANGPTGLGLTSKEMDSHPTPNARLLRIFKNIHRRYGESGTQLARVCAGWLLQTVEEVFQKLVDLSEAHSKEKRAHELYEKQRYREAAPLFRELISIRETSLGDSSLSLAAPLSNLGNCLSCLDDLNEAEKCFLRAVAICEAAGPLENNYLAISLTNLAVHYSQLEEYNAAEPYFRKSLDAAQARVSEDRGSFAICVENYLQSLKEQGREDDIQDVFQRLKKFTEI